MFANVFLLHRGFRVFGIFSFFHKSRFGWYQLLVPPMWLLIADDMDEIPYGTLIFVGWIAIRSNPANKSQSLSVETRWFVSPCCENMPRCVKGQSRWIQLYCWTICCCSFKAWRENTNYTLENQHGTQNVDLDDDCPFPKGWFFKWFFRFQPFIFRGVWLWMWWKTALWICLPR